MKLYLGPVWPYGTLSPTVFHRSTVMSSVTIANGTQLHNHNNISFVHVLHVLRNILFSCRIVFIQCQSNYTTMAANPAALLASFTDSLRLCGVTVPAVLNAITVVQGLQSINDFSMLTIKEIEAMAVSINKTPRTAAQGALVVTALSLKRIKAMREWVSWRVRRGLPFDAELFTQAELLWMIDRINYEDRVADSDLPDPIAPDKLKNVGHQAWIPFWKQFDNYCSAIRGSMKIPISYVYRDHVVVTEEMFAVEYDDSDTELMETVALRGEHYKLDNKSVWDILAPLVTHGHAWPFIKKFEKSKDGRGAILVLKSQAEGESSLSTRKAKAYEILKSTTYTGKSSKFTFENYIERLQFAFSELAECEQEVPESKKVETLMSNIETDKLSGAMTYLIGNPELLSSFERSSDYCMSFLARLKAFEPSGNRRGVASTTTAQGTLKLSYTPEEWKVLPQETKQKVIQKKREASAKKEKSSPNSGPTSVKGYKRKIKSLTKQVASLKGENNNEDCDETDDDDEDKKPKARSSSVNKVGKANKKP
jgi:hypothetical protein